MLSAAARALKRSNGRPALPALLFFTDPTRTPDPYRSAHRLPPGAAVVYRHFGASERETAARRMLRLCRRRRLKLLIGEDWRLAARIGADGVHLPERLRAAAPRLRRMHKAWLITASIHQKMRKTPGADAVVLAPVYPSASPSATAPLGARAANALAARARMPVFALGGVNARNIGRLGRFAGAAAIDALV